MGLIEDFLGRYRKEFDFYDQAARLVAQTLDASLQAAGIRSIDTSREVCVAATGDSGSVWVDATTLAPVALHKQESAVGRHLAIATSLSAVLKALNLQQV